MLVGGRSSVIDGKMVSVRALSVALDLRSVQSSQVRMFLRALSAAAEVVAIEMPTLIK